MCALLLPDFHHWLQIDIFTARKRSCGKVVFLQVSVILFTGGGVGIPACLAGPQGVGIPACLAGNQAHTQGGAWEVWRGGVSRPTPRGCIPACTEADPPPPADGYCCGRYASYWNAFLFKIAVTMQWMILLFWAHWLEPNQLSKLFDL